MPSLRDGRGPETRHWTIAGTYRPSKPRPPPLRDSRPPPTGPAAMRGSSYRPASPAATNDRKRTCRKRERSPDTSGSSMSGEHERNEEGEKKVRKWFKGIPARRSRRAEDESDQVVMKVDIGPVLRKANTPAQNSRDHALISQGNGFIVKPSPPSAPCHSFPATSTPKQPATPPAISSLNLYSSPNIPP